MTQETVEVNSLQDTMTAILQDALQRLVAGREEAWDKACEPLNKEEAALEREADAVAEAKRRQDQILPARIRIARYKADEALVAGRPEEAQAYLDEAKQAEAAIGKLAGRLNEIQSRIDALADKRAAAGVQCQKDFQANCQSTVRGVEKGFASLLSGVETALFYHSRPEFAIRQRADDLANLTAPERSDEWDLISRWYGSGGKVRR
jgi:hypothetical protein